MSLWNVRKHDRVVDAKLSEKIQLNNWGKGMIIRRSSVEPFDFDGLNIFDYTGGRDTSCSLAIVEAPPGSRHREAWSERSDKYYFVLSGQICFTLDGTIYDLGKGDFCLVPQGKHFSYRNATEESSTLMLVHSPRLDLAAEIFAEGQ